MGAAIQGRLAHKGTVCHDAGRIMRGHFSTTVLFWPLAVFACVTATCVTLFFYEDAFRVGRGLTFLVRVWTGPVLVVIVASITRGVPIFGSFFKKRFTKDPSRGHSSHSSLH